MKILEGADPAGFQRCADLLERNAIYQGWIEAAYEQQIEAMQRDWTPEIAARMSCI